MSLSLTNSQWRWGSEYLDSTYGASVFFATCSLGLNYLSKLPFQRGVSPHVKEAFDLSGAALNVPGAVGQAFSFAHGMAEYSKTSPQRVEIARRYLLMSGVSLVETTADATQFLEDAKIISLGKALSFVKITSKVSALARHVHALAKGIAETGDPHELQLLKKAKAIVGIALVALGLIGIYFASSPLVLALISETAVLSLALTTFWVGLEIATFVYDKIVAERRSKHISSYGTI